MFACQRVAETCLDALIDAIGDMPDPDPDIWGKKCELELPWAVLPQTGVKRSTLQCMNSL